MERVGAAEGSAQAANEMNGMEWDGVGPSGNTYTVLGGVQMGGRWTWWLVEVGFGGWRACACRGREEADCHLCALATSALIIRF